MRSSNDGTMTHGDMAPDHPFETDEGNAEYAALLAHATKPAIMSSRDLQWGLSNSKAKYSSKRPSSTRTFQ